VVGSGLLGRIESYSFPSGHSARATVLACYASFKGKWYGLLAWLWAFGIYYSRIALGVHWLSDVLGGLVFGLLSVLIVEKYKGTLISSYNRMMGWSRHLRVKH
jgi:membrane-associated phospholipid phosphatase